MEKRRSNIVTGEGRQESEERNHGNGDGRNEGVRGGTCTAYWRCPSVRCSHRTHQRCEEEGRCKHARRREIGPRNGLCPLGTKPKGKAVLMMPRPWGNAQEFRPRSTSSSQREDPSAKDEKGKANSIRKDIPRPENDNVEKEKNDENGSPVNQKKETVEK